MAFIDVVDIARADVDPDAVWGGNLELPQAGVTVEGRGVEVAGWVLGRRSPVRVVELARGHEVIERTRLNAVRPDLTAAFPEVADAAHAGFRIEVSMPPVATRDLEVRAVLHDATRVPLGVLSLRRRWRQAHDPALRGLVSVVVPCFDQGDLLSEELERVLAQTHPDVEIVVVDDGSHDHASDLAAGFDGVRCVRQEQRGLADAWNTGVRESNGDFLVFLDSAAWLLPHAFETSVRSLDDHPECAVVSGRIADLSEGSQVVGPVGSAAATVFRRAAFQAVGVFEDGDAPHAEMLERIARQYPVLTHDVVVAERRRANAGATAVGTQPALRNPTAASRAVVPTDTRAPADVSVVIPCYNQAHFLSETIESVLDQAGAEVEIVVVDDGSTDNTSAVARRYPRVRGIRQQNQGLAPARNTGLAAATGEFVVFLDADDLLLPGAIDAGLRAMREHPECVCVFGHSVFLMSDGSPAPEPHQPKFEGDYYPRVLAGTPIIATGSVLYRRRLFDEIGGFDPSISPAADYDLYYRVTRDHNVFCHGALVAAYRRHGGNMTSKFATMLRSNMISIRRQRRYVLRRPRYWSAYRRGVRYWQDHVGGLVAQQAQRDFLQRRLRSALSGVGTLIVWSPRSLGPMVRSGRWLLAPTEWKPEVG